MLPLDTGLSELAATGFGISDFAILFLNHSYRFWLKKPLSQTNVIESEPPFKLIRGNMGSPLKKSIPKTLQQGNEGTGKPTHWHRHPGAGRDLVMFCRALNIGLFRTTLTITSFFERSAKPCEVPACAGMTVLLRTSSPDMTVLIFGLFA
jgi:hypothetical protein